MKGQHTHIFLRLVFIMAALLFKGMLDEFYTIFSEHFGYYGINLNPVHWTDYLFSFAAVGGIAALLRINIKRPSDLILNLLYLFCFIPSATVFSMNADHPAYAFYGLSFMFLAMSLLQKVSFFPRFDLSPTIRVGGFQMGLGFLLLALLLVVSGYYGFTFKWVGFSDVYEVREAYSGQSNRLIGYFYGWLSHVLVIGFLLLGLLRRQYWLVGLAVAFQVYLYTLGGHKSVLLTIPFVLWVWWGARYVRRYLGAYLLLTLVFITAGLLLLDLGRGEYSTASSIFIRRNLLLPSQIYFHFIEYFGQNSPDHFGQNFPFSLLYDSQYEDKLPAIIGQTYFTFKDGIYANGNVFADLFANLGSMAFFIGPFLIAGVLRLFDIAASGKSYLFVLPLAAVAIVSLSNSGFVVNLITHGLLVMVLLFLLYPKEMLIIRRVRTTF